MAKKKWLGCRPSEIERFADKVCIDQFDASQFHGRPPLSFKYCFPWRPLVRNRGSVPDYTNCTIVTLRDRSSVDLAVRLHRRYRTPKSTSVEPMWITNQHEIVELLCGMSSSSEFLNIENVLPRLPNHPQTLIVVLRVFMAGDDSIWFQRLHLVQRRDPFLALLLLI